MDKREKNLRRKKRTRAKIFGSKIRPRLSVYASNKHIYVQIIDDEKGKTLASFSDKKINEKESKSKTKTVRAGLVGEGLAKVAISKKISKVVFDKGGYKYHGRVKALAEGARKGGLDF